MPYLDMRTIFLSYVISNAIGTAMLVFVWRSNRQRWDGTAWWVAGAAGQLVGSFLALLRGTIPDLLSIVGASTLLFISPMLQYEGLGRFVQQRVLQAFNLLLIVPFVAVHTYFTLVEPNLAAREINISLGLLVVCAQCAWLTLRQVQPELRPVIQWLGWIWIGYCLTSLTRIIITVAVPPGSDFFSESNAYDAWLIIIYQTLFVVFTFSIVLLVNHRLSQRLRMQSAALRQSEEKFAKAFHATPDAILITRPADGRIIEVNEGFCRISGYTREEAVGHSILKLHLWANPEQRDEYLTALQEGQSVSNYEFDFVSKSGACLTCVCASEIMELEGELHILTVARDITAARQAAAALRESEARIQAQLLREQQAAAAQAERERLARDLHDSMTQSLHSLNLMTATAQLLIQREQYDALPKILDTLRASAQQARHEMRLLVYELQLAPIDNMDLEQLLADRLAFVEQRAGLQTNLRVHGGGHIPPSLRKHLFFMATEALNNTLRHARATAVHIELEASPVLVSLRVSDDGRGFDAAQTAPGKGLRNMQAQAAELNGRFTIDSTPGNGTTMHLELDLPG